MKRILNRLRGSMSCGDVLEVIQAYIDGEIDAATARKVAAHLDQCHPCVKEEQAYVQIKTSLARRRIHVDIEVLEQLMSYGERLKTDPDLAN